MIFSDTAGKQGTDVQLSDKAEKDKSLLHTQSSTGFRIAETTQPLNGDVTQIPKRPQSAFGLNHSHSVADVVFNAYVKRIQKLAYEKFEELSDEEGLNPAVVTDAIEASGKYLKSLDEYGIYRKFIGTVILLLKNNHDDLTGGSARALVGALEVFSKSGKQTIDLKNFIRTCQASGISVVRLKSD